MERGRVAVMDTVLYRNQPRFIVVVRKQPGRRQSGETTIGEGAAQARRDKGRKAKGVAAREKNSTFDSQHYTLLPFDYIYTRRQHSHAPILPLSHQFATPHRPETAIATIYRGIILKGMTMQNIIATSFDFTTDGADGEEIKAEGFQHGHVQLRIY
jgi:hypothetical protein